MDAVLRAAPDDAAAWAERGALFAVDDDWASAVRDFERAKELDPELPELDHKLANALLHVGEPQRALELLDDFIVEQPEHADAHLVRGRARAALGDHAGADADVARSILLTRDPAPRVYLERAAILAAWGPDHDDDALAALRAGVERLGPLVTLVERAIAIEEARGRTTEALAWLARLPEAVRAAPQWRAERARLLLRTGRHAEAEPEIEAARAAIAALPASRRETEAMRELDARIAALGNTKAPQAVANDERYGAVWTWGATLLILVAAALVYRVTSSRAPAPSPRASRPSQAPPSRPSPQASRPSPAPPSRPLPAEPSQPQAAEGTTRRTRRRSSTS